MTAGTEIVEEEFPVLRLEALSKHFVVRDDTGLARKTVVRAVEDVTFDIHRGETVALVGESGCGKSTLARTMMRLYEPTSGRILFRGRDITRLSRRRLKPIRREMQIVFQDPFASLNPRMTVRDIVSEPFKIHGSVDRDGDHPIEDLLDMVGLHPEHADRWPHEFSGGQRQRVAIARALALRPSVLILDEPVTALDVSIQAQVVNLLQDLQDEFELTYVFIAHDLSVVRHIATRVAVMYLGRIVEEGPTDEVFSRPHHPYTQALLSAVPVPHPSLRGRRQRLVLTGDVATPAGEPRGCAFRPRCFRAEQKCDEVDPELLALIAGSGHRAACHFAQPLDIQIT